MVSDKTIHNAFRIHKTLPKQTPLEIFYFIFIIYPNYTLALTTKHGEHIFFYRTFQLEMHLDMCWRKGNI